jgi:hypothetical protein
MAHPQFHPITIDVLVAVNVGQAIADNALPNHVYMVDTARPLDSIGNGDRLDTVATYWDKIVWTVASIDPAERVTIQEVGGDAIDNKMIAPVQVANSAPPIWVARVESVGNKVQYSMTLLLEDKITLAFNAFLTATLPPEEPADNGAQIKGHTI